MNRTKLKMHPSIQLASGRYFHFLEPDREPLIIEDIAAGLSRICRYTGQLRDIEVDLYSVAQHSVLASEYGEGNAYENLMHDSAESVIGDCSSPFKQLLDDYREVEGIVEPALAKLYDLPYPMSPTCKAIDTRMLATEKRDLMHDDPDGDFWGVIQGIEPLPFTIRPWSRKESYYRFLHQYRYLRLGLYPQPNWEFGKPHEHAPQSYKDGFYEFWGNDDNCAAVGIARVVTGSRLPCHAWVPVDVLEVVR